MYKSVQLFLLYPIYGRGINIITDNKKKLLKKSSIEYIIKRHGYILPDHIEKSMGSAYGGKWKPKREEDKRLLSQKQIQHNR